MVFTVLLVLIPISAALKYLVGASALLVFASSAMAIAVLAEWVRRATDQLADRVGPACVSACNFDPLRRGIGVQF